MTEENPYQAPATLPIATPASRRWGMVVLPFVCIQALLAALYTPIALEKFRNGEISAIEFLPWLLIGQRHPGSWRVSSSTHPQEGQLSLRHLFIAGSCRLPAMASTLCSHRACHRHVCLPDQPRVFLSIGKGLTVLSSQTRFARRINRKVEYHAEYPFYFN